jgi:arylsulfatase A
MIRRLVLAVACAFAALIHAKATAAPAAPPNVIFILCDDLGYGDLGCYGQQKIKTPNVDRLASEGLRFTQFYSGSPVCGPSRSCLLTGLHTGHTPVRGNPGFARKKEKGDTPLPADITTFPRLFKQAGYSTAIIGKWGLGNLGTTGDPAKQGFDHFFGYMTHTDAHDYYPPHLWRNNQKIELDGKQYAHDLIEAEALKWIRESGGAARGKPFMLYLTFTIPHSKLQVPSLGEYEKQDWPESEKKFAAMMSRMDSSVGKVLDLIKELKLDERTLIVFTSDNGPHKEGGHSPDFFDSNGPLRGIKRDLYEGGVRVPFIARWSGTIKPGVSDHIAAFWDVVPTSAEILSHKTGDSDGVSFLPTLLGKSSDQKQHEYLYWEFQEQGGKQALRMGNYKAIRLNVSTSADAAIELYDLSRDLAESRNIASEHSNVIERARKLFDEAREPSEVFPLLVSELNGQPVKRRAKRNQK